MSEADKSAERLCKKCLLMDFDEKEYFRNIYEYINSIPAERKTDAALYARRLDICRGCDKLATGMCRVCGCFVEVRAAIAVNYCPDIKKHW